MSETREDLGYIPDKPEKPLKRSYAKYPVHYPEADEKTAERRSRSLEAILKISRDPKFCEGGLVEVCLDNRRIDFYPASDTYYLHSQQSFGHDIRKLSDQILAWKEKRKHAERP